MRKDLHGHSPYGELVGTRIVDADEKGRAVEVTYQARKEFTNRLGTVSGGMLSAMLDSATGLAALVALPEEAAAAHTELRVEYLRPVHPGPLAGRARAIDLGDRDIRSCGELIDTAGNTVARGKAPLRILRGKRRWRRVARPGGSGIDARTGWQGRAPAPRAFRCPGRRR